MRIPWFSPVPGSKPKQQLMLTLSTHSAETLGNDFVDYEVMLTMAPVATLVEWATHLVIAIGANTEVFNVSLDPALLCFELGAGHSVNSCLSKCHFFVLRCDEYPLLLMNRRSITLSSVKSAVHVLCSGPGVLR